MEEKNKNVDQGWKEKAEKEKESLKEEPQFATPVADFTFFISTLSLQAGIFLGTIPHPVTNKKEEDLTQAKFIIDTLAMLQEKTKSNLSQEETKLLENLLYELRMQYVEKTKNQA